MDDLDELFAEIRKEIEADRNADYSVTPEEAERLRREYPKDTPEAYKRIDPAEFFDGRE